MPKTYDTEDQSVPMYILKNEKGEFVKGFDDIFTARDAIESSLKGYTVYYKDVALNVKVFDYETVTNCSKLKIKNRQIDIV